MIDDSRNHSQFMLHQCSKTSDCLFSSFEKDAPKSYQISCTKLKMKQLLVEIDKNEDFVCLYNVEIIVVFDQC